MPATNTVLHNSGIEESIPLTYLFFIAESQPLIMRRFVYFPTYLKNETDSSFKEVIKEIRALQFTAFGS